MDELPATTTFTTTHLTGEYDEEIKFEGEAPKAEGGDQGPKKSLLSRIISPIINFSGTSLDKEGAAEKASTAINNARMRSLNKGISQLESKIKSLEKKAEAITKKLEANPKEEVAAKLEAELEDVTFELETEGRALTNLKERKAHFEEHLEKIASLSAPVREEDEPAMMAPPSRPIGLTDGEEDDALLELEEELPGEDDAQGVKAPKKDIDVTAVGPKSTIGADFAPIMQAEGTATGPMLRAALKSKVVMQNSQITAYGDRLTKGGNVQQMLAKGTEIGIHSATAALSEIAGWAILLPAVGLDHLVGSLDDVKETYHSMVDKLGGSVMAKGVAGLAATGHLIAWVMKHIAVLAAAGLTIAINSTLFLADKLASGAVALVVHGVANAARFVGKHYKAFAATAVGAGVIAGIAFGLKALIGSGIAVAAGAGFVAILPYIGMAVGGLLAAYLVLRTARYIYDHYPTTGRQIAKALHDDHALTQVESLVRVGGDTDELVSAYHGSETSRKYARDKTVATHSRVIGYGAKNVAKSFATDVAHTFMVWKWNAARGDAFASERHLETMTDEQLQVAVVDYNVDKSITSVNDQKVVKAALLASLRAGKEVLEYETLMKMPKRTEEQNTRLHALAGENNANINEKRAIVKLFSGSDSDILEAVRKYTSYKDAADEEYTELFKQETFEERTMAASFLDDIVEEVEIEKYMNQVTLEREVKQLQKDAVAMNKAIFEKDSAFLKFLEKRMVKGDGDDLAPANHTVTNEDGIIVIDGIQFFNPNKVGKVEGNPFGDEQVKELLGLVEVEVGAETELSEIAENETGVNLVQAYQEFKQTGYFAKRSLRSEVSSERKEAEKAAKLAAKAQAEAERLEREQAEREEGMVTTAADLIEEGQETANAEALITQFPDLADQIAITELKFTNDELGTIFAAAQLNYQDTLGCFEDEEGEGLDKAAILNQVLRVEAPMGLATTGLGLDDELPAATLLRTPLVDYEEEEEIEIPRNLISGDAPEETVAAAKELTRRYPQIANAASNKGINWNEVALKNFLRAAVLGNQAGLEAMFEAILEVELASDTEATRQAQFEERIAIYNEGILGLLAEE